ncbi:MAG: Slp family lipoprotein [Gammaproteobacteria bacterium]|nr:Slp family lipoprotein [Gammaproteobacteria bacterium]
MHKHRIILLLLLLITLSGCATPYDIGQADPRVTPQEAAKDVPGMLNHTVAWGGVIATAKNLKDKTELEVVAYPLDASHRPDSAAPPTGRFIVIQPGYLETADYAPGRLVTVVGDVSETRRGTVGEAPYVYPIVAASKLQLWPKPASEPREPRFHFGVGVGIIR